MYQISTLGGSGANKHVQSLTKPWTSKPGMKQKVKIGYWLAGDEGGCPQAEGITEETLDGQMKSR